MATYQYFVNTYLYYQLVVEEVGTSIDSNTSTVNWYVQVGRSNYGYSSDYTWSYSVSIGGNTASGSEKVEVTHDPITIGSGTFYITHNSDGTGSVYSSATVSSSRGSGSMGGTMSLTAIPRASTISAPTFTLGSEGTITIDRKSTSFTHMIRWYYGDDSGIVTEKTSSTSIKWTPDIGLSKWTPSATLGVGKLRCVTYSGNTEIGYSDISLWCAVPASAVPTINSVTLSETNDAVTDIVGSDNYVQSQSKIHVTVSGDGIYGSTISKCVVAASGVNYSGHEVTLPAIGLTSFTITVTITDTRGRTASQNVNVTQLPYFSPLISSFSCDRCTSGGVDDDSGDYCKVKYSYNVSQLESYNKVTAKVQYKRHSLSDGWSDLISIADNSSAESDFTATDIAQYNGVKTVSSDYQWDLKFILTDSFGIASEATIILHSAAVILDFKADGTGIGIGKTSEDSNLVDIGWPLRVTGNIEASGGLDATGAISAGGIIAGAGYYLDETELDVVVASGTSGGWKYIKYNSGLAICTYLRNTGGINVGSAWGSIYGTDDNAITAISYPFAFTSAPVEIVSGIFQSGGSAIIMNGQTANTTAKTATYEMARGSNRWISVYLNYFVMGYWK